MLIRAAMSQFPRPRLTLYTLLYSSVAALIVYSYGWGIRDIAVQGEQAFAVDDLPALSSTDVWMAAARSLTSLPETVSVFDSSSSVVDTSSDAALLDLQRFLPRLYHSPEVFALNSDDMTKNLRIFIYPSSRNFSEYEYGTTGVPETDPALETDPTTSFFRLLSQSRAFLTDDPMRAHLFFLRVSIDSIYAEFGPERVGDRLRHYVESVRGDHPFWDRSLGADHFYLSRHTYQYLNHRNTLELSKNAIQVACSPLQPNQTFFPHKDITLPQYNPAISAPKRASPHRSRLAYVSPSAIKFKLDVDLEFEPRQSPDAAELGAKLGSSKFCVSVSPHAMRHVVESLRLGCVPVLVSESVVYDLPFQGLLNWHEFAVLVGVEDVADLKGLLRGISGEQYEKMRYLGMQASKHLEWNDPPVAYDAFHMTMLELWVRRHSIKYERLSDS